MSWQALNLAAPEYAKPSEPPWLCGLIYRGKRHAISGPPEAAKTLLALIIALEALRTGTGVAFIDFESGPAETRRLLEDLGATTDELASILYFEADGPPAGDDLQDSIIDQGAELVIIDAAAGAYDASGLNENDRGDIEKFARAWVRPLWRNGIATILVDHVVKNKDNRGRFAIGGERKLGGVDVHLGLSAVTQMSRGSSGLIKLSTHKDRPGWLSRPHPAELALQSDPATHAITWAFRKASEHDEEGVNGWRPSVLMERVSKYLEQQADEVTVSAIYRDVKGKREWQVEAVRFLVSDGYATEREGNRGSRLIRIDKPYRDAFPIGSPGSPTGGDPSSFPVPPPQGGNGNGSPSEFARDVDEEELERLLRDHADIAESAA